MLFCSTFYVKPTSIPRKVLGILLEALGLRIYLCAVPRTYRKMNIDNLLSEYVKLDDLKALEQSLSRQLLRVRKIINFLTEDDAENSIPVEKNTSSVFPSPSKVEENDSQTQESVGAQEAMPLSSKNTPKYSVIIPEFLKTAPQPIKSSELVDLFHKKFNPLGLTRSKVGGMIFPALTELYRKEILSKDSNGYITYNKKEETS